MSEEEQKYSSPRDPDFVLVSPNPINSPTPALQFPSFAPIPLLPVRLSPAPARAPSVPPVVADNTMQANNAAAQPAAEAEVHQQPVGQQQSSVQEQLNAQAEYMQQLNQNLVSLFQLVQQQQAQFNGQSTSPQAAAASPDPYAHVTHRQSMASTLPMHSPGLNMSLGAAPANPLKHAKIDAPEKFHGKPGTTAAELNFWLTSMEIYMKALGVDDSSEASLNLAMTRLAGGALNLVINLNTIEDKEIASGTRRSRTLLNWQTLKTWLKKEYVAESQVQISRNKLMTTLKYTGSIVKYNGEFYNELVQVPELNDPVNKDLVMNLYAAGIRTGRGPYIHVYSRRMQTAMQNNEVQNLHQLMNMMKVTENNEQLLDAGRSSSRNSDRNGAARASAYGNSFNSSTRTGPNGNNGRWSGNWRSPARAPNSAFQTPVRVNNIEAEAERKHSHGAEDDERENGGASAEDNAEHTGSDSEDAHGRSSELDYSSGDASSDEDMFLHAIKIYDRMKKEQPNLTPEELDRRRRAGTCFRCNKEGHYCRDCPQAKRTMGPNPVKYTGQKK